MRLVPFGEYIPLRSALGWRPGRKAGARDRRPGTKQVVMTPGRCASAHGLLRVAFPDMSRHLTGDGVQLLIAESSTSSFQHSWAFRAARLAGRAAAAEDWRPMVHAP